MIIIFNKNDLLIIRLLPKINNNNNAVYMKAYGIIIGNKNLAKGKVN
jgi:hypothetical protein